MLVAAAALTAVAGVALAGNGPSPRSGQTLGMVPARAAGGSLGSGNLAYHGGPVEPSNTVYAIYWVPPGYSIQSGYDTWINRFFTDVAADSGKTTNVYASDTQYYGPTGQHIAYSSTFGGSYTDTSPLPASACRDSYTAVCLSDAQIQAEIQKDVTANNWTASPTAEFFMFTAKGIGSCAGSSCAFSQYCAYHSWIGSGSSVVLYANMPYADTVPAACDGGQHPNGSEADATINVTSHEHNETITDEQGNAWYDRRGYEDGDKCAWKFGTQLGGTSGQQYNQVIDGDHYELQMEYSNKSSSCVLTGL
jgi:hypothetical protein